MSKTTGRSTPKGGRPRRDGSPARPRVKDPVTGRFKKQPSIRPTGSSVPLTPTPKPAALAPEPPPLVAPAVPGVPMGPEAAQEAVAQQLAAGMASDTPPAAGAPMASGVTISYSQLLEVGNVLVANQWPRWAMQPQEQEAIGKALDACIAKWFPNAANVGPEAALILAVVAYVVRVFMTPAAPAVAEPERKAA